MHLCAPSDRAVDQVDLVGLRRADVAVRLVDALLVQQHPVRSVTVQDKGPAQLGGQFFALLAVVVDQADLDAAIIRLQPLRHLEAQFSAAHDENTPQGPRGVELKELLQPPDLLAIGDDVAQVVFSQHRLAVLP